MTITIAKKEFTEILRDERFRQQEPRRRSSAVETRFNQHHAKQQALVNLFHFLLPAIVMQEAPLRRANARVSRLVAKLAFAQIARRRAYATGGL
jgi:hypothetical protein